MLPGKITAEELYDVARSYIKEAGYTKEFFHRLGHGIGIDVHEYPLLDKGQTTVLQNNMTFTIEPSIMIPNKLWIRVEDVIVVTPKGGVKLNEATTEMIVLE